MAPLEVEGGSSLEEHAAHRVAVLVLQGVAGEKHGALELEEEVIEVAIRDATVELRAPVRRASSELTGSATGEAAHAKSTPPRSWSPRSGRTSNCGKIATAFVNAPRVYTESDG
jgi:hypothetical protein